MLIITMRTDKPEAELGLYEDHNKLAYEGWTAHKQLAETIHKKIAALLEDNHKRLEDIEGIVIYTGPGSFTGLRIGLAVANTLAYARAIPVSGQTDENWIIRGIEELLQGKGAQMALPEYGSDPHITAQKH